MKTFYLNKRDGKFMGVCAGIADYFKIDPTIVRIAAVVVTLAGAFPWTLIAYGVAAWAAKPKPAGRFDSDVLAPRSISTRELREEMREVDRHVADVESLVTSSNGQLAREIEELR